MVTSNHCQHLPLVKNSNCHIWPSWYTRTKQLYSMTTTTANAQTSNGRPLFFVDKPIGQTTRRDKRLWKCSLVRWMRWSFTRWYGVCDLTLLTHSTPAKRYLISSARSSEMSLSSDDALNKWTQTYRHTEENQTSRAWDAKGATREKTTTATTKG